MREIEIKYQCHQKSMSPKCNPKITALLDPHSNIILGTGRKKNHFCAM